MGVLIFVWKGKILEPILKQMSSGYLLTSGLKGGKSMIFAKGKM